MNLKPKTLLLTALVVIASSVGISSVYAQATEPTLEPVHYVLAGLTFIGSGILYSSSGWVKKIRRKLSGEIVPLDLKKMGNSVLIGVILGIGAFAYSTYEGNAIHISTPQQFLTQIAINTTAILLIDKWILGRSEGETVTTTSSRTQDLSDLHNTEIPADKNL